MFLIFLFMLLAPTVTQAQGGPPLITDDPGTPGDGHWEINIAALGQTTSTESLIQVPYFDINYGWGERIQLKFETGGAIVSGLQTNFKGGVGGGLAGVKWRFVGDNDGDTLLISTYPQVYFPYFLTSSDPELAEAGSSFILPLEFTRSFGRFAINPEIGYIFFNQGPNQLMYGLVFSYQLIKTLELVSEVHGNTYVDGSGAQVLFNVGARYDLSEGLSLIASAGHTFQNFTGLAPEFLSYLGIQLRL